MDEISHIWLGEAHEIDPALFDGTTIANMAHARIMASLPRKDAAEVLRKVWPSICRKPASSIRSFLHSQASDPVLARSCQADIQIAPMHNLIKRRK